MNDWLVSRWSPCLLSAALTIAAAGCGPETSEAPDRAPISTGTGPGVDGGAADAATPRCSGKGGAPGDTTHMIMVGGTQRRYLLHVPPAYDASVPMPLVLAFHGFTDNASAMVGMTHYNEVGDQRGFITAYLDGIGNSWNAGSCCGVALAGGVDDVGFVKAVIDELSQSLCVDERRVFASGFSNGGFLSHRLACELSDRIAAIAVSSGQQAMPTCTPGRPVPVVQVHGTADPIVPYAGNPALGFPSTQSTIDGWAMRDGCGAGTTTVAQQGSVTCVGRDGCGAGAEVILCSNEGGVHEWVGGGTAWTAAGPPPGFNTSEYFADFLLRHPMP
jgi:polyhydroxybutyrate depolymerase